jgi:hypothetical protein
MDYAVELMVDAEAAAPVVALWREIHAACDGLAPEEESLPHISLTAVDLEPNPTPALEEMTAILADFAAETAPIRSRFQAVAAFPTEQRVVYLAPVVTRQLLDAHDSFHARLDQARIPSAAYYLPGAWIPHCTIAMQLPADRVGAACELACRADVFRPFTLAAVRLISIHPVHELARFELRGP